MPEESVELNPLSELIRKNPPDVEAQIKAMLSEHPEYLNQKETYSGMTPLHQVCLPGSLNLDVAKLLVEEGADLAAKDDTQLERQPIYLAASSGQAELFNYLKEKQEEQGKLGPIKIRDQVRGGNVVEASVDSWWKISEKNREIRTAGGENLFNQFDIKKQKNETDEKFNQRLDTHWKGIQGYISSEWMPSGDLRDKQTGDNLLHAACKNGAPDYVLDKLIEKGAEVNAFNKEGVTPLHMAIAYGHTDIVNKLIENGADVNAAAPGRPTPLQFANMIRPKPSSEMMQALEKKTEEKMNEAAQVDEVVEVVETETAEENEREVFQASNEDAIEEEPEIMSEADQESKNENEEEVRENKIIENESAETSEKVVEPESEVEAQIEREEEVAEKNEEDFEEEVAEAPEFKNETPMNQESIEDELDEEAVDEFENKFRVEVEEIADEAPEMATEIEEKNGQDLLKEWRAEVKSSPESLEEAPSEEAINNMAKDLAGMNKMFADDELREEVFRLKERQFGEETSGFEYNMEKITRNIGNSIGSVAGNALGGLLREGNESKIAEFLKNNPKAYDALNSEMKDLQEIYEKSFMVGVKDLELRAKGVDVENVDLNENKNQENEEESLEDKLEEENKENEGEERSPEDELEEEKKASLAEKEKEKKLAEEKTISEEEAKKRESSIKMKGMTLAELHAELAKIEKKENISGEMGELSQDKKNPEQLNFDLHYKVGKRPVAIHCYAAVNESTNEVNFGFRGPIAKRDREKAYDAMAERAVLVALQRAEASGSLDAGDFTVSCKDPGKAKQMEAAMRKAIEKHRSEFEAKNIKVPTINGQTVPAEKRQIAKEENSAAQKASLGVNRGATNAASASLTVKSAALENFSEQLLEKPSVKSKADRENILESLSKYQNDRVEGMPAFESLNEWKAVCDHYGFDNTERLNVEDILNDMHADRFDEITSERIANLENIRENLINQNAELVVSFDTSRPEETPILRNNEDSLQLVELLIAEHKQGTPALKEKREDMLYAINKIDDASDRAELLNTVNAFLYEGNEKLMKNMDRICEKNNLPKEVIFDYIHASKLHETTTSHADNLIKNNPELLASPTPTPSENFSAARAAEISLEFIGEQTEPEVSPLSNLNESLTAGRDWLKAKPSASSNNEVELEATLEMSAEAEKNVEEALIQAPREQMLSQHRTQIAQQKEVAERAERTLNVQENLEAVKVDPDLKDADPDRLAEAAFEKFTQEHPKAGDEAHPIILENMGGAEDKAANEAILSEIDAHAKKTGQDIHLEVGEEQYKLSASSNEDQSSELYQKMGMDENAMKAKVSDKVELSSQQSKMNTRAGA